MSDKKSYPLCWPDGWPRTNPEKITYSKFPRNLSVAQACDSLDNQLRMLGASGELLSTNIRPTLRGSPASNQPEPRDRGVAVYFEFRKKKVSLACDKWCRVADNIRAIALHVESLRGQERWGVGSIEQAFRGYMAIPERSEASSWWKVLGLPVNATREQIKEAYHRLAKVEHPDANGTDYAMASLNLAYEEATRDLPA